jgi:hypothetical protein
MSMSFWTNICRAIPKPPTRLSLASLILVVSVLVLGVWTPSAHAAKPSQEEMRTFKELVKEGSKLRDDGQPWKAIEKFEKARAILDHPKLTFNIGKLQEETGACDSARDAYTDVLARAKLPDDLRVEVVNQLKDADDCRSFGTLDLTCDPSGATVQIGDKSLSCPLRQKLSPGDVQLVVSAPGRAEQTVEVSLAAGQVVERSIWLDSSGVAAGDDSVTPPGESPEATPWMKYTAYGSIGVGAALLVGGLASDYSAQSRADEFVAANEGGDRARAQTLKSEADSAQVRTVVLYSAGTVLLGGGIALWAIDAQQEGDDAASVRTEIGWSPQGATVRGVLRW